MTRVTARSRDRRRGHIQVKVARTPVAAKSTTAPAVEVIDDIAPVLVSVPEISSSPDTLAPSAPATVHDQAPSFTPEVSAKAGKVALMSGLALDLVLNEISLQARLTTTATGAVIALARSGILEGRAMTGSTAPAVAACLNMRNGIASSSFHTGIVGRSDDLSSNTQADAQAYLRSGVRSTLVVQIAGENAEGLGVLQIFSPRANAFCDRDVLTLQALARRVSSNVEMAHKTNAPSPAEAKADIGTSPQPAPAIHQPVPQEPAQRTGAPRPSKPLGGKRFFLGIRLLSTRKTASILTAFVILAGGVGELSRSLWMKAEQTESLASSMTAQMPVKVPTIPDNQIEKAIDLYTRPEPLSHPLSRPATAIHQGLFSSIAIERKPLSRPISPVAADAKPTGKASPLPVGVQKSLPPPPQSETVTRSNRVSSDSQEFDLISTQSAMKLLVQRVEPEYPNAARQQHIQGTVMLDAKVNAEGTVDGVTLVSGESQLMNAAAAAVQQWKFQPFMKDGKPRKFESRIAIDFKLVSGGSPQSP